MSMPETPMYEDDFFGGMEIRGLACRAIQHDADDNGNPVNESAFGQRVQELYLDS